MSRLVDDLGRLDALLNQAHADNVAMRARLADLETRLGHTLADNDALRDVVQGLRARNAELESKHHPGWVRRMLSAVRRWKADR